MEEKTRNRIQRVETEVSKQTGRLHREERKNRRELQVGRRRSIGQSVELGMTKQNGPCREDRGEINENCRLEGRAETRECGSRNDRTNWPLSDSIC